MTLRRPSCYNNCGPNKIRNDGRMLETGTRDHHQAFFPEIYYIILYYIILYYIILYYIILYYIILYYIILYYIILYYIIKGWCVL